MNETHYQGRRNLRFYSSMTSLFKGRKSNKQVRIGRFDKQLSLNP